MRITSSYQYERSVQTMQTLLGKLTDFQDQLSTLKQIQKPSDSPLDSALVMNWKAYGVQVDRWQNNIKEIENRYSYTEQNLTHVKDLMLNVRDLVIRGGGSDALGPDEKEAVSKQMVQQAEEMLSALNAKYGGRFVLANAEVTNPADPSWKPFKVVVDDGTGSYVFKDSISQAEEAVEQNHADGKTDSKWMVVFEPKEFSELSDSDKKTVSVEIGSHTTMPQVLAVEDYFTLKPITIDGNNYHTVDMFDKLYGFVNTLKNGGSLASADNTGKTGLDYTDEILDKLTDSIASIGARVQRLDTMTSFYNNVSTNVESLRSSYEDADLAKTYTEYTKFNTSYQSLLKVIASITPLSLVNYL
ncbi:flagellar hook-associated protein FlgL [Coprothermobacter platensis]|uniref:flagellar hook-associated protein FlgL n=1 Tax=Coprothermobacter platensis TaxID=108819 RepID=UPI00036D2FE7|nr:flagellar hook-associated protein FlgL [Coprothermobacter platensis]